MSAAADGNDAGLGSGQAGDADYLGLDGRRGIVGREHSQVSGPAGRFPDSRCAADEGPAAIAPLLAEQTMEISEQNRDSSPRPSSEPRQTPKSEPAPADAQTLNTIDSRHEGLQALAPGALGAAAAREAVTSDVSALDGFADKTLQDRAAAVMGDTAEQHLTYRTVLKEVSPKYAALAERAHTEEQLRSTARKDRKASEYVSRRDNAMDSIARPYATMASAGLTVNDLRGPALDRLDVKDSRDLLLIEGFPPQPRASKAKALLADSLKNDAYRATFDRETAEWAVPGVAPPARVAPPAVLGEPLDQASASATAPTSEQRGKTPPAAEQVTTGINSLRSEGESSEKRRAIPPLADRFNVKRIGLVQKEYHFRDPAGTVAFTDKLMSITTGSESPATIQAMVDRAAERGWATVRLGGSPEFVRQGWIAAAAQGLKPVGHAATAGDREAAEKERARLQFGRDRPGPQRPGEAIQRVQSDHVERVSSDGTTAALGRQRQLAAAIEKALLEGRVSPELRGHVRTMMAAEGAKRTARGERFKVPVFDALAPRPRVKTVQPGPQRPGDRERAR